VNGVRHFAADFASREFVSEAERAAAFVAAAAHPFCPALGRGPAH